MFLDGKHVLFTGRTGSLRRSPVRRLLIGSVTDELIYRALWTASSL